MKFLVLSLLFISSCKSIGNNSSSQLLDIREKKFQIYDKEFSDAGIEVSENKTNKEKTYLLMEQVNRLVAKANPSKLKNNVFIDMLSGLKVIKKGSKEVQQRILVTSTKDPFINIEFDLEPFSIRKTYNAIITVGVSESLEKNNDELEVLKRQLELIRRMIAKGLYSAHFQESAAVFTTMNKKKFKLLLSGIDGLPSALKRTDIDSVVLSYRSYIRELGLPDSKARVFVVDVVNDPNLGDFLKFIKTGSLAGIPVVDHSEQ